MPSKTSPHDRGERKPAPWAWVALLALALLFFVSCWQRIWGADFWWQFATGRYIAEHGIPRLDPFSNASTPRPWIELRWLYCLAIYQVISHLGLVAVAVAKLLILGGAFGLMLATVPGRRASALLCIPLLLAILAAEGRFFLRPEIISLLLFAAYVWLLQRYRMRGGHLVWLIPPLQVLWTNSHTIFILGPLLVGLAVAAEALPLLRRGRLAPGAAAAILFRLRLLMVLLLATSAACLANPYGDEGIAFPFQLFRQIRGTAFKEYIAEFAGIFSLAPTYIAVIYFEVLLALGVVSALLNFRRLDAFLSLLWLVTAYLTILAVRNLPLFALASIPFIAGNLLAAAVWPSPALRRRLSAVACVLVAGVSSYYAWQFGTDRAFLGIVSSVQFGCDYAYPEYPVATEQFLRENQLPTPIYNTLAEGSYLLAHGHRVFIDPRLEVYGEKDFSRFIETLKSKDAFDRAAAEFGFRTVFVGMHSKVINHVAGSPAWALVSFDECAAVFVRADSLGALKPIQTTDDFAKAVGEIRRRLRPPPALEKLGLFQRATNSIPYQFLADFLRVMRQPALALPLIEDAIAAYPETTNAKLSLEAVRRTLAAQAARKQ